MQHNEEIARQKSIKYSKLTFQDLCTENFMFPIFIIRRRPGESRDEQD